MPNMVNTLIEKNLGARSVANVPSNAIGTTIVGMMVANVLQKQKHHQEHQNDRPTKVTAT
jgi:hypothetical protein